MAAKGEVSLWAMTAKPGGMAVMRSPWLIQTVERWPGARRPSNKRRGLVEADLGAAVLALGRGLDPAAELGAHGLLAVADAEHRDAELEHGLRGARAQRLVGRGGAAGEDDRGRGEVAHEQRRRRCRGGSRSRRGARARGARSAGCIASRNRGSGRVRSSVRPWWRGGRVIGQKAAGLKPRGWP